MKIRLDLTLVEKDLLEALLYNETQTPEHDPTEGVASRKIITKLQSAWYNAASKSRGRR